MASASSSPSDSVPSSGSYISENGGCDFSADEAESESGSFGNCGGNDWTNPSTTNRPHKHTNKPQAQVIPLTSTMPGSLPNCTFKSLQGAQKKKQQKIMPQCNSHPKNWHRQSRQFLPIFSGDIHHKKKIYAQTVRSVARELIPFDL